MRNIYSRLLAVTLISFLLASYGYCADTDYVWVPYNDPTAGTELLPKYRWACGCTPTAIAMVLGYWDNYGPTGGGNWGKFTAYGRLIDYYVDEDALESYQGSDGINYDWAGVWIDTWNDCPTRPMLIVDLSEAMDTTGEGGTINWNKESGTNDVLSQKGYGNNWAESYWITLWGDIKDSINDGEPCEVSIPNHSVCCFGYSETLDKFATYDTNQELRHDYPKSMIDSHVLRVSPQNGNQSEDVDLKSPDGGQELVAGSTCDVKWYQYNGSQIDNIDLYYSLDGGRIFTLGASWISSSPGLNSYSWSVPSGISSTRVRLRVEGWDGGSQILSEDGSQENFTIRANHNPDLTSGDVDPNSGDTSTTFSYIVHYYDQDGDSPSSRYVYIDGSAHVMSLYSGSASNGTYRYQTTLSAGSHNYYFYFTDGSGGSDTLPSSGSYTGPSVSGVNHNPDLTSGDVDPNSGDTSTTFSYIVHYYDQDGDSPSSRYVYIDGSAHVMSLYSGSASNGTYRYQTTLSAGSHNYYFYFTDGSGGSDTLPSSGSYTGPSVSEPTEPDISVSPPSHDYGDVPVGGFAEQVFTVSNDGNDILHVSGSSIVGDNSDQFSIVNGSGFFDLEPGDSHSITVRFSPTSTGTKNAILRISSDDPDEPQKDVNLTGNGKGPIYVDLDATGSNDGSSWEDAYTDLQSALAAAQTGDEIWVAEGTYVPGTERTDTFQLVDGVALYGGFNGAETTRDERNWRVNVTILTGDVNSDDDGFTNNDENVYHVLKGADNATIDGFTIIGGNANGEYPDFYGGGIFNWYSAPTIFNCDFYGNRAQLGGGGIFSINSSPVITRCTFIGNHGQLGGAIENSGSSAIITNCLFFGNIADNGGTTVGYGGAIMNDAATSTITNCIFFGNRTNSYGGAICNIWSSNSIITNCTFSNNNSSTRGGSIANYEDTPIITNCIFWDNTAPEGTEIYNTSNSSPTISYCDINGCGDSGAGWDSSLGIDGGGNIDAAPLFVDADGPDDIHGNEDDNFHLGYGSPCINAGTTDGPDFNDMGAFPSVTIGSYDWLGRPCDFASIENGINQIDTYRRGGSVLVSPGVYNEYNIELSSEVDIIGSGADEVTINGGGNGHVLILNNISNVLINGFTITGNRNQGYAAIWCEGSTPLITNNVIINNPDPGIRCNSGSNGSIINNIFVNNEEGVVCNNSSPLIVNNTFYDNHIGVSNYMYGTPTVTNNIFANNYVGINKGGAVPSPVLNYNNVWNSQYADYLNLSPGPTDISVYPHFVNIYSNDFHLQQGSPCIDAGDPVETLTADYIGGLDVYVDLVTAISAGNTIWITDGLNTESDEVISTTDTTITLANGFSNSYLVAYGAYVFTEFSNFLGEPEPNGNRINMGAYGGTTEATTSSICEGDFDEDGDVDGSDLAVFAADFGRTDCSGDCEGDFDEDNDVDGSDLAIFAADFGRTDCLN